MHCWQITPDNCLIGTPCSVTAMACANACANAYARFVNCSSVSYSSHSLCIEKQYLPSVVIDFEPLRSESSDLDKYYSDELGDDGYLSLDGFNRMVRKFFPVKKKLYFKRNERPTLREYLTTLEDDAFICVKGHYIYADTYCDGYWSFFDNAQDPVICVWLLGER